MTVAWESDSWIALRNCSLKVREEPEYIVFEGENKTKQNLWLNINPNVNINPPNHTYTKKPDTSS